jgi:predicted transcriptional regulator
MIQVDVLQLLVEKGPGRTEIELARSINGDTAYQQQVNQDLRMLVDRGTVVRQGAGGVNDPYRYHPKQKPC